MPLLQIAHKDGRVFNVAESAFEQLYEPFGFKPVYVVYAGFNQPYNKENLEAARLYEERGASPNQTAATVETEARLAIANRDNEDLPDEIRESEGKRVKALIGTVKALQAEEEARLIGLETTPPKNDAGIDVESSTETALKAKPVKLTEDAGEFLADGTTGTGIPVMSAATTGTGSTPLQTASKPKDK